MVKYLYFAFSVHACRAHTHTHTHTHTHVGFCGLRGLSIGVMVFILYKLYVLLPYTYPTPKLTPHRRLCASLDFQKTPFSMFLSLLNYGDIGSVLIKHIQIVIPLSYPCHYTNLCPHKPHKPAHPNTNTCFYIIRLTFHIGLMSRTRNPKVVGLSLRSDRDCWWGVNNQRSLLLQYHDWGVLEQGTEPPTAPRAL